MVCLTVTYVNASSGARAGTNTRAGFPQSQEQSLSSDESIAVAMSRAPWEMIQRLCCCVQLVTYKRWGKRTCFRLGNIANSLMYLKRRGRFFRVILFLSCGEDTMYRSPYLLSCGEKLPHWLHTNVHFISLKAHKTWGEISSINSSQTLSWSNLQHIRNCSAKGSVRSEES